MSETTEKKSVKKRRSKGISTASLTIRLPTKLHEEAMKAAERRYENISTVIRRALHQYIIDCARKEV